LPGLDGKKGERGDSGERGLGGKYLINISFSFSTSGGKQAAMSHNYLPFYAKY